jgi:protein ImuA
VLQLRGWIFSGRWGNRIRVWPKSNYNMTPLLKNLAERIAEMERSEHPCRQVASLVGMPAWGDVLLGGKLGAGSLVELLAAEEGAGAWTLALFMARHACGRRKVLVVADLERRFYPPAASRLRIDLRRTIVIRPKEGKAVLAAMTQSLRCAAVGAAIGKLDRLSATDQRRLQVAAESGGGVGFLLRPAAALSVPSFATVRLRIAPVAASPGASANVARRIQVEVVRFRGGKAGQSLVLEIDDDKGHVRLPAFMADAKSPPPPARASG